MSWYISFTMVLLNSVSFSFSCFLSTNFLDGYPIWFIEDWDVFIEIQFWGGDSGVSALGGGPFANGIRSDKDIITLSSFIW